MEKIQIKSEKLTHQDLGQMQMYVNYFDRYVKQDFEKPTIGILAKTEHSHPLGMVVSTHFRCGKGVKRGLKNGALPFKID